MEKFEDSFNYRLIYIFEIRDNAHRGLLKIGDTKLKINLRVEKLTQTKLNQIAKNRIKEYTNTAGIEFYLLHTELAIYKTTDDTGKEILKAFRDHDVHRVLLNSNIEQKSPRGSTGKEWFKVDLETAKQAITAVKENRKNLSGMLFETENFIPITLRPEQEEAVSLTVKELKKGDKFLWNAKMRFGKTLCALEVVRRMEFAKTIIITHRPVVDSNWYDDFQKIFHNNEDYIYGSKNTGYKIEQLLKTGKKFVYFASMQDLRGSETVGGKFSKNAKIFSTAWDFVIVDEAHEGTTTALGDSVIKNIVKEKSKFLALSGTPFNILNDYEEKIFTWDYISEQRAKFEWSKNNFGDSNPYDELPTMNIFTYNLGDLLKSSAYYEIEDKAFNFREFFRTDDDEKFVHEQDIKNFLNLMVKSSDDNYPYSTAKYRKIFRHSLWMIPGIKAGRALSKLLKSHTVFKNFEIVNVAGNGDADEESADALEKVRDAIDHFDYTITLSCGKLTTGVTVPEWTAVFMLAGSFSTSAASYLQTIFRVQSPCNKNGKIKENCYVFDFAPDRTLKMIAESVKISSQAGKTTADDREILGEFLNFCPIISVSGSQMKEYDANKLLQQLKRAYAERAVKNGFDDKNLYNDELLKLDNLDIEKFNNLKAIIGTSKAQTKIKDIDINSQGFTDEQYEQAKQAERKPPRELSQEEKNLLEELKQKNKLKTTAISILRGISIRMPLLIYGANIPLDEDFKIEMFLDDKIVDPASWEEFMPKDVTKQIFNDFIKYYDQEIFISAGHRIRNLARSADELKPTERVKKLAEIFSTFKNPDKETVLTPFRVVNIHLSDCLGGWDFFDERHENILDTPRFVETKIFNANAKILEINSKTGLYPLLATYNFYRARLGDRKENSLSLDELQTLWDKTVSENIFVICKTPMAKAITQRTLAGFRPVTVNALYFENLVEDLKFELEKFILCVKTFWKKGKGKMEFDAVVGNPPYQVMDNGAQASAKPLYNYFVEAGKRLGAQYMSFIIPSRWYAGGKGLDLFRDDMLEDKHLEKLFDCLTPEYIFPNTNIRSGVCWFLRNTNFDNTKDLLRVVTIEKNSVVSDVRRPLKIEGANIFIRHSQAISILNKVRKISAEFMEGWISPLRPFGFRGYFTNNENFHSTAENLKNPVACIGKGLQVGYVERNIINVRQDWIDDWKLIMPRANNIGTELSDDNLNAFVSKPKEICTESYLVIGGGKNLNEFQCKNICSYFQTKFARFMHSLAKASHDATAKTFCFVPLQDFSATSDIDWQKNIADIDKQLYKKYNLSVEEINFIESTIKPMD